jgi:membrane-associated PAP2 superfamily phosphatase
MMRETINKQIIVFSMLIVFTILLFNFTDLDVLIQDYFYNFDTQAWLIDENNAILRIIFYSGFKNTFKICAAIMIIVVICLFTNKFSKLNSYKKGLLILFFSCLLVPCLAEIKHRTNMPCPFQVEHYGGKVPEIKLFERFPKDLVMKSRLRCYPAGHATMGFSLMALYFLFKKQRNKNLGLIAGITLGVLTGGYKMLIGDHFLSHTLVTMFAAWLIILIVVKLVNKYVK